MSVKDSRMRVEEGRRFITVFIRRLAPLEPSILDARGNFIAPRRKKYLFGVFVRLYRRGHHAG